MSSLKACIKLLVCLWCLLSGIWTIATRFPKSDAAQRGVLIAQWSRRLLGVLNVKVHTTGQAARHGPMLVVINHISWLDILVMLAAQPVSFVSKSEVKHWPLIGWLATNVGTLYIERAKARDALRVVHQIADALRGKQLIAVFPEGTTSNGEKILPFHANLLEAACQAQSPVQPVALRYLEANGQRSYEPAYIDNDTLVASIWRMLRAQPVTAQLDFLEPVQTDGMARRELALLLHRLIAGKLAQ